MFNIIDINIYFRDKHTKFSALIDHLKVEWRVTWNKAYSPFSLGNIKLGVQSL